jgi:hypothetical protein
VRKGLILLVFDSYEAVRLWWLGGNGGVVSFGKTPFFCSIPTLASRSNRSCGNGLGDGVSPMANGLANKTAHSREFFHFAGTIRRESGNRWNQIQIGSIPHENESALSPGGMRRAERSELF